MSAAPRKSDHVHAVTASFLGWTLDAFDFFIVVMVLPEIAKDFHVSVKALALSLTLTLAFRPVGAFLFGLLADRYGRRLPLMIDLVFFSIIEVLSGLAPDYRTFMILRALFGIGMGGEWGVGASLAMEKAPRSFRGMLSGLLQEGYAVGNLLAAGASFFILPRWGWRPMFFLGGLPALLALYVRFGITESEVWERTRHANWGELGRGIASHWKLFLYLVAMLSAMALVAHSTQDMYPTFLKEQHGFSTERAAVVTAIANVGAILGGLAFGFYSDRAGRRRAMITSLALALAVIPLWAFAPTTALLIVGAFTLQFMVQGAWGVVPAHITELSPDSVRGFLPGFAYQCGVLISGTAPYVEAVFAAEFSYATAMALTAATVFAFAVIVVAVGQEKHAVEFGIPEGA